MSVTLATYSVECFPVMFSLCENNTTNNVNNVSTMRNRCTRALCGVIGSHLIRYYDSDFACDLTHYLHIPNTFLSRRHYRDYDDALRVTVLHRAKLKPMCSNQQLFSAYCPYIIVCSWRRSNMLALAYILTMRGSIVRHSRLFPPSGGRRVGMARQLRE